MVKLYSNKTCEIQLKANEDELIASISYLNKKEKDLLLFILMNHKNEFTPIEVCKKLNTTNKTIINRLSNLVKNGFIQPILVNKRIRSYQLSDFAKTNIKTIIKHIKSES